MQGLKGSCTLRPQALRPQAPLRLAAAPARAVRAAPLRCVAGVGTEERLPAAVVRKVAFDGSPAGEVTLALHTSKESSAVGLVHRYITLVRQNARRVRGRGRSSQP